MHWREAPYGIQKFQNIDLTNSGQAPFISFPPLSRSAFHNPAPVIQTTRFIIFRGAIVKWTALPEPSPELKPRHACAFAGTGLVPLRKWNRFFGGEKQGSFDGHDSQRGGTASPGRCIHRMQKMIRMSQDGCKDQIEARITPHPVLILPYPFHPVNEMRGGQKPA